MVSFFSPDQPDPLSITGFGLGGDLVLLVGLLAYGWFVLHLIGKGPDR